MTTLIASHELGSTPITTAPFGSLDGMPSAPQVEDGPRRSSGPTTDPARAGPGRDHASTRGTRSRCSTRPRDNSTSTSQVARIEFDLPLDLHGTPFQLAAWKALRRDPVRRDPQLRGAGGADRATSCSARDRHRERAQSGLDRPSVPPRRRQRRCAARLRRRPRREGGAARVRASRPAGRRAEPVPATLTRPGRARWGGSGSLNPKSAPAGPNAVRGAASSGLGLRTRC